MRFSRAHLTKLATLLVVAMAIPSQAPAMPNCGCVALSPTPCHCATARKPCCGEKKAISCCHQTPHRPTDGNTACQCTGNQQKEPAIPVESQCEGTNQLQEHLCFTDDARPIETQIVPEATLRTNLPPPDLIVGLSHFTC